MEPEVEVLVLWAATAEDRVFYLGVMGDYEEPNLTDPVDDESNMRYSAAMARHVDRRLSIAREYMTPEFTKYWTTIETIAVPLAVPENTVPWPS